MVLILIEVNNCGKLLPPHTQFRNKQFQNTPSYLLYSLTNLLRCDDGGSDGFFVAHF